MFEMRCLDKNDLAHAGQLGGLIRRRLGVGARNQNINVAASLAALASLDDKAWLSEKMQALVAERQRMGQALTQISYLQPYPTQSNFILCRVLGRDAGQLKRDLEQEGILVRYFNKPGLDNCIRISAGRPEGTDRLLTALKTFEG